MCNEDHHRHQQQQRNPVARLLAASGEGGGNLGPSDFRQQKNLVIFFFDSLECVQCRGILKQLWQHAATYRLQDAAVLGVAPAGPEELESAAAELEPDVTLLADEDGCSTSVYQTATGASPPFLVVADRYGALYATIEFEEGDGLDHRELESILEFIETQCP